MKPQFNSCDFIRQQALFEPLESRVLASVSYVRVGLKITPNILTGKPAYFSSKLPAGDFEIVVVGGSMTYNSGISPGRYAVNDFIYSDHGFKVVEPNVRRFNGPGLSIDRSNSKLAAAESVGVALKFRHSTAGKIGMELFDYPYADNLAGLSGSPTFVLKERVVTTSAAAAVSPAIAAAVGSTTPLFSSTAITNTLSDADAPPQDQLAALT